MKQPQHQSLSPRYMRIALNFFVFITMMVTGNFAQAQYFAPADSQANAETRWLLSSMHRLKGKGVLFGHHDDTAYGVHWKLNGDSSDVRAVTGSLPALYGWDISNIEVDMPYEINAIPFKTQTKLIREAYELGGVNAISWHMINPATGGASLDTTHIRIKDVLPGGSYHEKYKLGLDRAAAYFSQLRGHDGEPIPVLFRPFHELNGDWFWWGTKNGTDDEFINLWRFTIDYLRHERNVHNLLVVYSTFDFYTETGVLARYPGDDYVDFIGFDTYCVGNNPDFQERIERQMSMLNEIATEHRKLICFAETGYQGIPESQWWTSVLLPSLTKYGPISYVMTWRNDGPTHYFAPYPGQPSAADFKVFKQDPANIFQDRLTPMAIYGPKHFLLYNRYVQP